MFDHRIARSRWAPYIEDIALACAARFPKMDAALVASVWARETWFAGRDCPGFVIPEGLPAYMGRGDGGHGWGAGQVDDRGPYRGLLPRPGEDWPPFIQACCTCIVLAEAQRILTPWRARISDWTFDQAVCASYNAGVGSVVHFLAQSKDPDRGTTPGRPGGLPDYGRDVLSLRDGLRQMYPTVFPPVSGLPALV